MKRKFTNMACGIAAASILSLALTACDSESPSAPSSGVEKEKPSAVEGSDTDEVSSSSEEVKARCDSFSPECGYTEKELCEMGHLGYCGKEPIEVSSSSEVGQSSSSFVAQCDAFMPECGYSEEELCQMGYSNYCNSVSSSSGKQPVTCRHITDYDGMTATGNCNSDTDQETVTDCVTGKGFRCVMNYWTEIDICPPGSNCSSDTISGTPCDRNGETLVIEDDVYQCNNGVWQYLPPPMGEKIVEEATDVSAMGRGGPAVSPRVVKVLNASGSVTFRDDGVSVDNRCTFNGLKAELRGDTLYATIEYPGCTTTGGSMGVITFTLSSDFADAKYIKYEDGKYFKEIHVTDELLPCGNTSSCNACREGAAC